MVQYSKKSDNGQLIPLIGATITWATTSEGTVSDMNGYFNLRMNPKSKYLVVSYVGYAPDTVYIEKAGSVNIVIAEAQVLN